MNLHNVLSVAYIVFSGVLLFYAFLSIRWNRPALAVLCGFSFFYLSLRPVMLLTGNYGVFGLLHGGVEFDLEAVAKTFGISIFFLIAVFVGYGRIQYREPDVSVFSKMPSKSQHLAFTMVWLACIISMLFVSVSQNLNWFFSFVILGGVYFLFYRPQFFPRFGSIVIGATAIGFALLQSVERRDWAIAIASVSLIGILRQPRKIARTTVVVFSMFIVITFSAIMLRTGETLSVAKTVTRLSGEALLPIIEVELDFPLVYDDLVILMREVPESENFTYGKHFFKPLYSWIPRNVWPSKPDTMSRYYSERLNTQFHLGGGSEPVTFIGELYWNFALLGALLAFVFGKLVCRIDRRWLSGKNLLQKIDCLVLSAMLFYLLRGPFDTFWLAFAFYFAAWILVSTLKVLFERLRHTSVSVRRNL